jgi:DUF2950 family protein
MMTKDDATRRLAGSLVREETMAGVNGSGWRRALRRRSAALGVAAALAGLVATTSPAHAAGTHQRMFASPEAAVEALITAARADRTAELVRVLGPEARKLVVSGDPVADKRGRAKFAAAFGEKHTIETASDGRATLVIGDDEWPFPIPIVRQDGAWRFDTGAGEREILRRRIGRNELDAIEVCRAYVDAQREYAAKDRNGDGILEYAQKFVSAPGRQDGLYWRPRPGEPESPIGPLMARARAEGYAAQPYHGYFFRILKGQGKAAPGGAYSYLARNRMIGGFALVAYPAQYGASGVMTFIVNQDGVVYERNLGRDTAALARRMTVFDPDPSWAKP